MHILTHRSLDVRTAQEQEVFKRDKQKNVGNIDTILLEITTDKGKEEQN